jgi:ATP-dependent DNA ligase
MTHYPSRNETILSSVQTSKSCISETSLWPHNGVPSLDKLIFAGKAGTGFDLNTGRDLVGRLRELERSDPPFAAVPRAYQRGAGWAEPRLVADLGFTAWTRDGRVRHPSFNGLREDNPAKAGWRKRKDGLLRRD